MPAQWLDEMVTMVSARSMQRQRAWIYQTFLPLPETTFIDIFIESNSVFYIGAFKVITSHQEESKDLDP
jgi:hypothetical protein